VEALARDIQARHTIKPERVLAHSDVAPRRKIDPGEKFPWARLAAAGVGHWVEPTPIDAAEPAEDLYLDALRLAEVQRLFGAYGYRLEPTRCLHAHTRFLVKAFHAAAPRVGATAFPARSRRAAADGRLAPPTPATPGRLLAALQLSA